MTFDLLTSTCLPSIKFLGPSVLQLLSRNHFSVQGHCDIFAQGHCDLDFRPTELKFNRGLPLGMTNLHTKYGVPVLKRSLVIERKPFISSQGHRDLDL